MPPVPSPAGREDVTGEVSGADGDSFLCPPGREERNAVPGRGSGLEVGETPCVQEAGQPEQEASDLCSVPGSN